MEPVESRKKGGIHPPNEDDSINSDLSACGLRCVISDCDGGRGARGGGEHEACDSSITERCRMHKLKVSHQVIAAPRSPFV